MNQSAPSRFVVKPRSASAAIVSSYWPLLEERALAKPGVEAHANTLKVGAYQAEHPFESDGAQLRDRDGALHGQKLLAVLAGKLLAKHGQVLALIAVLGQRLVGTAKRLCVPGEGRVVEKLHLRACVVHLVLAGDDEAGSR